MTREAADGLDLVAPERGEALHQAVGRVDLEVLALGDLDDAGYAGLDTSSPSVQSEWVSTPKLYLALIFGSVIASQRRSGVVLM